MFNFIFCSNYKSLTETSSMEKSERETYECQISLLKDQIEEQKKREESLKGFIDTFAEKSVELNQIAEQRELFVQQNEVLHKNIKEIKDHHQQQLQMLDKEISRLKAQLSDKNIEMQRAKIIYDERQLKLEKKIHKLEQYLENQGRKTTELDKKLHEKTISSYKESANRCLNQDHYLSSSRLTRSSHRCNSQLQNTSRISTSKYNNNYRNTQAGDSHLNSDIENNMGLSNLTYHNNTNLMGLSQISQKSSMPPDYDLIKMTKQEMKTFMKVLKQSKAALSRGQHEISMLSEINPTKRIRTLHQ